MSEPVEIILKSDAIVRALMELGATGEEEVAEQKLKTLTQSNFDQIDANLSQEDLKLEKELLDKEVLDRIKKEGLEVMLQIIDRAYQEAYYEANTDSRIII